MELGGCYLTWRQLQSLGMDRDRGTETAEGRECLAVHSARCMGCPTPPYLQPLLTPLAILLCISELSWHTHFVDLTYKSILFTKVSTGARGVWNWSGDTVCNWS